MSSTELISVFTATLAAIVAWTGYQQHVLAREKLKLDLFEKRFVVFQATGKFLATCVQNGFVELDDLFSFRKETYQVVFLFEVEMSNYIERLYQRGLEARTAKAKYSPLPLGVERSRLCDIEAQILEELGNELGRLPEVFAPYMKFRKWR